MQELRKILWKQFQITKDGDIKWTGGGFALRFLAQGTAALSVILFFLPLCSIGGMVDMNGIRLAFGVQILGERVGGNIAAVLLLIFPAGMIAIFHMKQLGGLRERYLYSCWAGAMQLISLIISAILVGNLSDGWFGAVSLSPAYFLNVFCTLVFLLCCSLAWFRLQESSVETETDEKEENEENEKKNVLTDMEEYPKICYACGNILKKEMDFCPRCGTRYRDPLGKE